MKDILSAKCLEDIYSSIIDQRIYKLFYASPADYFKYLKETIQIDLDEELIATYIEIKATRDLLVHNNGKINALYVQKSGDKARTTDFKQNISITEDYYILCFSTFKKIIRDTYEAASKKIFESHKKN